MPSRRTLDLILLWAWLVYLTIGGVMVTGAISRPWHFPEETIEQRVLVVLIAMTLFATGATGGAAMTLHFFCTVLFLVRRKKWVWLIACIALPFYGSTVAYLANRAEWVTAHENARQKPQESDVFDYEWRLRMRRRALGIALLLLGVVILFLFLAARAGLKSDPPRDLPARLFYEVLVGGVALIGLALVSAGCAYSFARRPDAFRWLMTAVVHKLVLFAVSFAVVSAVVIVCYCFWPVTAM